MQKAMGDLTWLNEETIVQVGEFVAIVIGFVVFGWIIESVAEALNRARMPPSASDHSLAGDQDGSVTEDLISSASDEETEFREPRPSEAPSYPSLDSNGGGGVVTLLPVRLRARNTYTQSVTSTLSISTSSASSATSHSPGEPFAAIASANSSSDSTDSIPRSFSPPVGVTPAQRWLGDYVVAADMPSEQHRVVHEMPGSPAR